MADKRSFTAAFTGHRKLPQDPSVLIKSTEKAVVNLIERGVLYFGAGGALGYDSLAASLVLLLRDTRFPQIKLIQVLPFRGMEDKWSPEQKEIFYSINDKADKVVWLADRYAGNELYLSRNRYLVDHSAHLIVYCTNTEARSGTASCYQYAVKQGVNTILVKY